MNGRSVAREISAAAYRFLKMRKPLPDAALRRRWQTEARRPGAAFAERRDGGLIAEGCNDWSGKRE